MKFFFFKEEKKNIIKELEQDEDLDDFRESIWEKFKEEILGSLSIRNDEQVILNVPEDPSSEEFSLDRYTDHIFVCDDVFDRVAINSLDVPYG
jgi:hypothetical protein